MTTVSTLNNDIKHLKMDTTAPLDLLQRVQSLQDILEGKACECEMEVKVDSNCLMDSFLTLYDECQHDILARNKHVASFLKKYSESVKNMKKLRVKPSDFEVKATVGHGHFGEVRVVHEKTTDTVYAMKVLRKSDLLSQPDISFFEEERNIMAQCTSPWLTKLHFAFQDSVNLYLVMDFHPGGDLLSLLCRHDDVVEENMARFYLAEMAVAINALHTMGYLHRDIKPENILLDNSGHIKLADFGSAAKMDSNRKVSSRMPVGTPDYVAPELLDSMNRASSVELYGPEVDWWSLGVCAYEMLFGATPFTDESGSMVATYGNIMNFKKKLKFPSNTCNIVSGEARDLISRLLSDSKSRLAWPEIQKHPFFKNVQWDSIRDAEPPYIPSLSSLDDTSHFDEVEKPKSPPCLESFLPTTKDFSGRDLPFVGFSYCRGLHSGRQRLPKKSVSGSIVFSEHELDSSVGLNTARFISPAESCTSVTSTSPNGSRALQSQVSAQTSDMEVTVTVKITEMRELRERCLQLETERRLLEGKLEAFIAEKTALERELKEVAAKNQALIQQLEQEKEQAANNDRNSVEAWHDLQTMNSHISSLEDQMLSFQLDELREIIVQLETEQEGLTRRLLHKDRQLEELQESLNMTQQQLASKQHKLDRERRKSRDNQKRDMALLESQEDSWCKQLDERQATIDELLHKVRDLEDLIEAYEEQEDQQASELQQLHYKLNTSLMHTSTSSGVNSADIDFTTQGTSSAHLQVQPACCNNSSSKQVSLQVMVRPGRQSIRDNKTIEKLKDLQGLVERYSKEARNWQYREEQLQKKASRLEDELRSQCQKEGVTQQMKDSLMMKLHVYQQEVHMQRNLIKELQKKMRSYLDEQTTITQTEAKLKELQCQNLDLEGELFAVRQEAEDRRQLAMDKTREMEDIISKLEKAQLQVKEYQDKYSQEVENTDIRTKELEERVNSLLDERGKLQGEVKTLLEQVESLQGLVDENSNKADSLMARVAELQQQLQELTKRNADLLVQVESLQKAGQEGEQVAVSRAELNTQLNRLQQHNDELQHQLQVASSERRSLEEQTYSLQRETERLNRRIARLQGVEAEKHELQGKLDGLNVLEREKKRLEVKVTRLEDLEREKAHLQMKIEQVEMEKNKLQLDLKETQRRAEELSATCEKLSKESHAQSQEKASTLSSKILLIDLLKSEKEELQRQVKELKLLQATAKEDKDEAQRRKAEVNELRVKITALEKQVEELGVKIKNKAAEERGLVREKNKLSSDLEDARSQLRTKTEAVERLEKEKTDFEKKLETAKSDRRYQFERPSVMEGKSCLVERLQAEKASLQRQLEEAEKERDCLKRSAVSGRLRESSSRNSLTLLRESGVKLRADLEDKVQRLERVVSELEGKLKISDASKVDRETLQKEIEQLRVQIKESVETEARELLVHSEQDSLKEKCDELQKQVVELHNKVQQLSDEKLLLEASTVKKNDAEEVQHRLEEKIKRLEEDKKELELKASQQKLVMQQMQEELKKEKMVVKEGAEKLKNSRSHLTPLGSSSRLVGDLTQEKHLLESKVKSLERQIESLKKRRQSAEHGTQAVADLQKDKEALEAHISSLKMEVSKFKEAVGQAEASLSEAKAKNKVLETQVEHLTKERNGLHQQVSSLQNEAENHAMNEKQSTGEEASQLDELKQKNVYLQTKVEELEKHLERANTRPELGGKMTPSSLVQELRKELHESNLAVSEARSLLSAAKRQEAELREKVAMLQRMLDNGAVMRASHLQIAQGAEHELRVLKSQYETLQRQYKNLEEKQSGSHRDRAATVMEVTLLREQLQTKQHQLDMETKKNQKLTALCSELEEQVKDMEIIIEENEKQECEWNQARQTFQKAVSEREQELEEVQQKLQATTNTRTLVDSRVNQLSQQVETLTAAHRAEVEKMNQRLLEERNKAQKLAAELREMEEKEHRYRQVMEMQGENIEAESQVIVRLKEEISQKITENNELKSTNIKLCKHLDQAMDKFELIFGEKVNLENFTEALQGLKKFASSRNKDGSVHTGLPLQWTDLQTALEQEQKKTTKLQEQLDRLREENFQQANELLKIKGPLKERADNGTLTPKARSAVATLVRSPSAQAAMPHPSHHGYYRPIPQPAPQRMHHNIPHRFVTGLNTRATKCGLCLGSVHFVKQASKCQECGMVVHPKCATSVPATCGLPTEYVRLFADMMSRIEESEAHSNMEPVSIKMEGWLKVPRTGKPGWEKRWVELDGSCLLLYKEDSDAHPIDTFDLSPPDADVSVHSAVTAAELTNIASLDLYYVLRLDQDPLTTCWPGRYLYLMTTNFSEKQRWVATLEAAVRNVQRKDLLHRNRAQLMTVVSLKDPDRKEFNCALVLSPQIVLLGTDDGLFALDPQTTTGRQYLVQLTGFGSVHQIAEAKGINMVLLLTGPERRLVMVESKLIKCRMSQTIGGETTPFTYKSIEGIQSCTVFDVALWGDASYLCVGMPDKVVLLKYNPSLGMYCIRKEMASSQPCSCVCIADSFALVGTERFYRISLEHPSMLDFVDRQDSSLAFAAFGAANHHSFPLAVVQVSPEGLPLEFLLCFHEFGVFVDHRGQRSRQSDIKWSGLPLSFSYTEPFLYITYFNSLHATVVPTDKDQVKGSQTAVDMPAPRYLGRALEKGSVYVATSNSGITEVVCVQAKDERQELPDSDDEKENCGRTVHFAPSPDKCGFRVKASVSLVSLESSSSASTFTSVESNL
ncbi:citron Rho-interacting kinase-like isoform X2 [Pomacea canaliculata]|uniref:citron Rho-interacting kinase-like isoform X2 n=1 Tax=Pomacea canaliculata TaxID=400727 RepID=UPI000D733F76|nr:citron Rho-interacting kinase-like isoform X2 [Pomacea canaliculata]